MDQHTENHTCRCPFCEYDMNDNPEDMQDHISYWGSEDGAVESSCPSCGKDFFVIEQVDRTWTTQEVEFYPCSVEGCDGRAVMQEPDEQPCECFKHVPREELS